MTVVTRGGRGGAPARLAALLPDGLRWPDIASSDADTVELKVLLDPEAALDAVGRLCGLSARRRRRRLYLLDTADLAMSRVGVDVRLRRRARGSHDLSVRSRHRGRLHDRARPPGARVELDLLPGTVLRTTELRRAVAPDLVASCLAGALHPTGLLRPSQWEWLTRSLGPRHAAGCLDALVVHGPVAVQRVRVPPDRVPVAPRTRARAFLEHAVFPSGREIVEFSVRCGPEAAADVARVADRLLADGGVVPARRHHTKSACWASEVGAVSGP